jgi:nucleoside-diphosphate-sugar epimerase
MAELRDQNVLVSGADGFIGSHLVEKLVAAGARVRALSQYNSFNYWGWLEDLACLDGVEVVTAIFGVLTFARSLRMELA